MLFTNAIAMATTTAAVLVDVATIVSATINTARARSDTVITRRQS